jgi:sulfonate transport system permease protein
VSYFSKTFHLSFSRMHILVIFLLFLAPFLFLLVFSRAANISTASLLTDVGHSMYRMLIAFVISILLAWILAALFYRGRRAVVGLPLFDVLQSFPTFAALPIAVQIWGASDRTVIFFLVITMIWPMFFTILSALKLLRHDWQEVMQVYQVPRWFYIWRFLVPATLPAVITGCIIGLGEGWEALVATEMIVGTPFGLGDFFQTHAKDLSVTAFGILGFLILIFCINKLAWLPLLEWSHRNME